MIEPRTAAATARRRSDSEHKRRRVLTVAGAFIDRGQDFSLEQLARAAQVNPGFVHRAPGLKTEIETLRHSAAAELEAGLRSGTAVTMASVKAQNVFLKRRLHEREQDIATLKRRLGEALGRTIVSDTPAPGARELGERIAELEQQLFEAQEALRDRDEQLQAVRTLNQKLLKEQNLRGGRTDTSWPAPPSEAVYHGPAGEFVLRTDPHTESHPMALLSQFLVAFGTATGAAAHYAVEASRHHSNEFIVLVGPSAKGRKGSAWDHVEALMRDVDETFVQRCIASGMSSGEGLIAEVADNGDNGSLAGEKRKLIVESEFAQVMKVLAREGNTLSPVIRNAWDGKTLQTMAKNSPLRATGAHIGIVGHITKQELLRHISATELANGFFNRFMVVAVKRSKTLPFGGRLGGEELERVREQVRLAARFASVVHHIAFDPQARDRWIAAYDDLSRGEAGLAGAATARAEAHTVRLALIYALLDCSQTIQIEHLDAALAFWAYSAASARWVFGDSIGDPTADEIWSMARQRHDGITRTEVSNLFSRNKKAREIDRALQALTDAGRLERAIIRDPRNARIVTVWRPVVGSATNSA